MMILPEIRFAPSVTQWRDRRAEQGTVCGTARASRSSIRRSEGVRFGLTTLVRQDERQRHFLSEGMEEAEVLAAQASGPWRGAERSWRT